MCFSFSCFHTTLETIGDLLRGFPQALNNLILLLKSIYYSATFQLFKEIPISFMLGLTEKEKW